MRVCDRHPTEKAADELVLNHDGARADLCAACIALVRDFIGQLELKTIDPEKPKKKGFLGLK